MTDRPPMSIREQAEFVEYLVGRTVVKSPGRAGETAAESYLLIKASEVEDLRAIAARLHRMSPFEDSIRKMVVGQ